MTQSSGKNIKIFKFSKIYKIFINLFQTMYNVFQCDFCVIITVYIYLLVLTLKTHQNCALCKCKTLIVGFFWFFLYFHDNLYDCGYFSANLCTYCVCCMLIKCILNLHQNMLWIIFSQQGENHEKCNILRYLLSTLNNLYKITTYIFLCKFLVYNITFICFISTYHLYVLFDK